MAMVADVHDKLVQDFAAPDVREGPDHNGEIELKLAGQCLHEHHYTTMCGVTRCLVCDQVVG